MKGLKRLKKLKRLNGLRINFCETARKKDTRKNTEHQKSSVLEPVFAHPSGGIGGVK